jgi:hypothetical protein
MDDAHPEVLDVVGRVLGEELIELSVTALVAEVPVERDELVDC